ncbi:MAG: hypothetical protein ACRDH2_02990 [Anaerolineales bacterium]
MSRAALAVAGLAVGLGLGLLYSWVVSPVKYVDTAPASLRADYQAEYVQLVARAFAVDEDLERARARLALLDEADPAQRVTAFAQQAAASGNDPQIVRSLAALAAALGAGPASPIAPASTDSVPPSDTPQPTLTPDPTATLAPTVTPFLLPTRPPTPTLPGAFDFIGKQLICDPALGQPLIQVLTLDSSGAPTPGVEVIVEWDGGFDHFFTGLKPELGLGYGDFAMMPGIGYNVHLPSNPAAQVAGLAVETCTSETGRAFAGSWQLVFRQP